MVKHVFFFPDDGMNVKHCKAIGDSLNSENLFVLHMSCLPACHGKRTLFGLQRRKRADNLDRTCFTISLVRGPLIPNIITVQLQTVEPISF